MSITANEANTIREHCNKAIDLMNCLKRLEVNPDFKKLTEEYLEKEPVRIAGLYGEANINMDKNKAQYREDLAEALIGIGRFACYLRMVHTLGEQATNELNNLNSSEIEG